MGGPFYLCADERCCRTMGTVMAEKVAAASQGPTKQIERRAFVRLTSDLTVDCRPAGHGLLVSWPGSVRDISRGGLGLQLRHRFRPGTRLTVELRNRTGPAVHTVRVRVVHATAVLEHGSHAWLLGCVFDEPLAEEIWDALA